MNSPVTDLPHARAPKSPLTLRTVTADESGQRIDNFLMRHFKTVPRSRVYRLLRKGEVRVNRKRVDAEYRIQAGDEVRLPPVRIEADARPGRPSSSLLELIERAVIFQDRHLLVIDKPAGCRRAWRQRHEFRRHRGAARVAAARNPRAGASPGSRYQRLPRSSPAIAARSPRCMP